MKIMRGYTQLHKEVVSFSTRRSSSVTRTSRDATDRQRIVIDFICSTLDGYESCTGIFLSILHSRIYAYTHTTPTNISASQDPPFARIYTLFGYTHRPVGTFFINWNDDAAATKLHF